MRMQDEILDFWFGPRGSAEYGKSRAVWFRKDAAVDQSIRTWFGGAVETALAGGFGDWTAPRAALARVLLLDQFTRNIHRGTPQAFAGDGLALGISKAAVADGDDRSLIPVERWFLYMPFEHAEDRGAQQESLALFTRLRDESGLGDSLKWAERHAAVIRRFGRYPHRNAALGRESTPEEIEFLATPGSGF
jgi:uncharacterized protein (DUF924 family)